MKLVAKYNVEAPAAFVFEQIADFDKWERAAMRRGADVMRTDTLRNPGPGMTWASHFSYRGKERDVTFRIDALLPSSSLGLTAMSATIDGVVTVDILDLAANRTRIEARLELKPKTLATRIYVQSLRLARSRVERSFAQRVAQLAVEIEERFRKTQR